jgi:hypothetical protein
VSPEEVALQWSLFDQALAHNATDPQPLTDDAAVNVNDNDVTDTLITYAVGSDVESVLKGSGLGVDGRLVGHDAEVGDDNTANGKSNASMVPSATAVVDVMLGANQSGG